MTTRRALRPGGRSARVQEAVHRAVCDIRRERGREGLTVPVIAERAGVTPSTIYRRWGDLPQLLADVAVENLRPDGPPEDTGSFRGDMEAWLSQYFEEMSSKVGRTILREAMSNTDPLKVDGCRAHIQTQFDIIRARALGRGEGTPSSDVLIDLVVAPLIFRLLFSAEVPDFSVVQASLERALREVDAP